MIMRNFPNWLERVEFWHVHDLDCCGPDEAFPHLNREVAALLLRLGNANQYRHASQNLRTTFEKIITRARMKPWPKVFQNMRSSRETELVETYPVHVVTARLGNTASVAAKHYLQTTEEQFERTTQNPTQQASVMPRIASHSTSHDVKKTLKNTEKPMFLRV